MASVAPSRCDARNAFPVAAAVHARTWMLRPMLQRSSRANRRRGLSNFCGRGSLMIASPELLVAKYVERQSSEPVLAAGSSHVRHSWSKADRLIGKAEDRGGEGGRYLVVGCFRLITGGARWIARDRRSMWRTCDFQPRSARSRLLANCAPSTRPGQAWGYVLKRIYVRFSTQLDSGPSTHLACTALSAAERTCDDRRPSR